MKTLFSIIGLVGGAIVDEGTGAVFGFFIGLLAGALVQARDRILAVERKLADLQGGQEQPAADDTSSWQETPPPEKPAATTASATPEPSTPEAPATSGKGGKSEEEDEEDITLLPLDGTGEHSIITDAELESDDEEIPTLRPAPHSPPPGGTTWNNPVTRFIREFFTTGNVVVKVGILILITGVAFLLKLAAEHHMFPVEYRFIGVAALAMVIFYFGWDLRDFRRNYALVLQGGAVGILYVTVYVATLEQFSLLPLGLAFGLMFALVAFSCMLAVIQDAKSLAVFATAGGFLAPVLTSTGAGNHVGLFSYYAFLNAGIFGIAWYKSWRSLNWLGFIFTFVIASLWGQRYYQPRFFDTTEPFLVAFFLFYVAIAILFAIRQPPKLAGMVDGSLVFGTPLVGFSLQVALVKDFEFGESISALIMGAFYVLLARLLWRRHAQGLRLLSESFLALGIIFATVAIPFALDGRWTAVAWALEGAGIAWVGIRQGRKLARLFGLLLQVGAAVAFLTEIHVPRHGLPVLNSTYIGMLLISISALFTGLQFYRHRFQLHVAGRDSHIALLVWGLAWWFMAGLMEIDYHVVARFENNAALFFIATSMWVIFICARALRWPAAEKVPVLLLPVMYLFAITRFSQTPYLNPFGYFGYAAWIMSFVVQYGLLFRAETSWNRKLLGHWHALTLWLYVFMATWVIANAVSLYVAGMYGWNDVLWGLVPTIAVFKLIYLRDRFSWPIPRFRRSYLCEGMLPMAVYLGAWVVVNCFNSGDPAPVIYVPVMNPQDIVQILAMLAILDWLWKWKSGELPPIGTLNPVHGIIITGVIAFAWLNSLVAQAIHFYAGVPHTIHAMFHSGLFQASISILWTLTAFVLMVFATQKVLRRAWFAGILLLAAVVIKLVLVDLADSGTVARIVSFITVGILMLIIGYFSPLPPKQVSNE